MKLVIRGKKTNSFPKELESPEYYIDDIKNKKKPFLIEKKEDEAYNLISATLDINHINFFVGANNSGKSRFMRGLLKVTLEHEYICEQFFFMNLLEELKQIVLQPNEDEILEKYDLSIKRVVNDIPNKHSDLVDYDEEKKDRLKFNIKELESDDNFYNELIAYVEKLGDIIKETDFSKKNKIRKKTYIPVLRSLLENDHLGVESFKKTVKKVFFEDKDFPSHININTGLDLWGKIDEMRRSSKIRDIESFELFLSECFFEGKRVELLARDKSASKPLKLVSIAIDRGDFRSVNEVGDGIQTIILLLFPIFTAERNEVFYIEEPETNLHPGFQRIFLETLLTNKFLETKKLKFFFTTHSNHFLDLTLRSDRVSFFQFQKIKENGKASMTTYINNIKVSKHLIKTNIKPNKETLDELGVNNSSVFLANTSLWVEGPTDRKYLAKFLRLYCEYKKEPYLKEDIDFAFFEYGGNLIAHYLFNKNEKFDDDEIRENINAFANANKIYLLVDNDNVKEGDVKYLRQQNLESLAIENPYFKYQNTVVKEIENILPAKIIKDFIKKIVSENVVEKLKTISFTMNDYKDKGLGEFYEEKLLEIGIFKFNEKDKKAKDKMRSFRDGNTLGTTYKNKLANFVIDGDYTYEDLIEGNDHLKNLIEGLYRFIKNENLTDKG